MARKPRLRVPGGLYHVILRGNARQDVFYTPADRSLFYDLLCEGVIRFGYRAHAFCLLTNHVHLALQAGETSPVGWDAESVFSLYTARQQSPKSGGSCVSRALQGGSVDQDAYVSAPGRARQAAQARTLIAWLAVQTRAATLEEIARQFDRSASTLSHLATRLEKRSLNSSETRATLQKHLYTVIQA